MVGIPAHPTRRLARVRRVRSRGACRPTPYTPARLAPATRRPNPRRSAKHPQFCAVGTDDIDRVDGSNARRTRSIRRSATSPQPRDVWMSVILRPGVPSVGTTPQLAADAAVDLYFLGHDQRRAVGRPGRVEIRLAGLAFKSVGLASPGLAQARRRCQPFVPSRSWPRTGTRTASRPAKNGAPHDGTEPGVVKTFSPVCGSMNRICWWGD